MAVPWRYPRNERKSERTTLTTFNIIGNYNKLTVTIVVRVDMIVYPRNVSFVQITLRIACSTRTT